MNGVSLFSSAGIAETYFKKNGIDILVASELLKPRCTFYSSIYKDCKMICGDITEQAVFDKVKEETLKNDCKFLLATPPCQGMSTLGKKEYETDKRNYLVFYALDLIDCSNFDFILIENVPKFLKLYFPYNGKLQTLLEIITDKYGQSYNIESFELNAKDYGVPQSRPRGFIKIWKKGLLWSMPKSQKQISLYDAIGHLPSLESGQDSGIKWHYSKVHNDRDILAMKNTQEGKSALLNSVYYPKKGNGEKMKGFHNTFKRMKWDEPSPARTMQSGNMGGHNNVHPGRILPDGNYSDARVLTIRELFIVSSLPADWNIPSDYTDTFIRAVIGEAIPPKFCEALIQGINT